MKIEITINVTPDERKPDPAQTALDELFAPSFAALDALIKTLKGEIE